MIDFHPPLLNNYIVPTFGSPNAFGAIRKHDIHTGVDLFCNPLEPVYAMEDGIVTAVFPFTGEMADSPWWNDTEGVLIHGSIGSFLYGEVRTDLRVGDAVVRGQCIGHVVTVLKKDKGTPMTMLHLELYDHSYIGRGITLRLHLPKPTYLFNPSIFLSKGYQKYIDDFDFCGISVHEGETIRRCGGEDMDQYTKSGLRALSILGADSDTLTAFLMSESMKSDKDIRFERRDGAVIIGSGVVMAIGNLFTYGGVSGSIRLIIVVSAMLNLRKYKNGNFEEFELMRSYYFKIIDEISTIDRISYISILESFELLGIFS